MTDAPAPPPRPMGKVMGRQPDLVQIVPSRPNPWYGSIVPDQRFTLEQLRTLQRRSIDPATVETITVTRNATQAEAYWGLRQLPPVYQFECPVVHRRQDGRIMVIAPIGDEKLVYADGWPTPPRKRRIWE